MDANLAGSIARSLDADPRLLDVLPELLADLDALGGDADEVVGALRGRVGAGARVVDIACGKGVISIALAERLGAQVVGVDGMPVFVEDARGRANAAGVGELCEFRCGDVRCLSERDGLFDAALLIGAHDALGGIAETVGAVRALVLAGGVMVIDDGFLVGETDDVTLARSRTLEETRRLLTSHGDEIVEERIAREEEQGEMDDRLTARIRARAEGLAERRPELRELLEEYVRTQERAGTELARTLRYAMWVMRRGE